MKSLSKADLMRLGVTEVTEDGKIFVNGKERKVQRTRHVGKVSGLVKSYQIIVLPDKSVKRPDTIPYKKKDGTISQNKHWTYGSITLPLSRVIYAWFISEVPANMDVDHIDNNPENNALRNLQLISRKVNLAKRLLDNEYVNVNQYGSRKELR